MSSSTPDESVGPSASAEQTVTDLSARFADKVQIHLHPSSSLPPSLLAHLPSTSSAPTLPVALVWTVESLKLLRGYGVVGSFTGTLAQFPQQNVFLGMPVQLLAEEVVYLLRRGGGVVVDESASYRSSTVEERGWLRGGSRLIGVDNRLRRGTNVKFFVPDTLPTRARVSTDREAARGFALALYNPHALPALPWYTPSTYTTLSSIQHLFPFPSTPPECASVALFEHLLSTGLWCMNGLRFGGSFAVYPGDPLRYHSHYTAQLVLPEEHVGLVGVVANGRLGTSVKKTHLLCAVERFDEELEQELQKADRDGTLQCVKSGRFDVAPSKGEKGEGKGQARELASFNIFSLAWAGFGT